MANVTTLTEITSGAAGDIVHVVDVSDTTQSVNGSSRKITLANLVKVYSTLSASLTNKTIDGANNTISNLTAAMMATSAKSGADAALVTGTAGVDGNLVSWNIDGDAVDAGISATNVSAHVGSTANPHGVTAAQVGLGNVPNLDATDPANWTYALTGADAAVVTGTAGVSNNFVSWNVDGDAVDSGQGPADFAGAVHTHTEADITDLGPYIGSLVEDATPQLGGALDGQGNAATDIPFDVNAQIGTAYTLVAADASRLVTLDNAGAITLTVPTNATVPFATGTTIMALQSGAGGVAVTGASGVTIQNRQGHTGAAGQWAMLSLTKVATDTWVMVGDTA